MKLNKMEFMAMNNPIRRFSQKNIEFKRFKEYILKQKVTLLNSTILDAGCGSGFSSKLISNNFSPKELIAFDYMPEQIEIAKKKNPYAKYYIDDITNISQPTEKFDATFVFGILHHVPNWRQAIKELYRVIKTGGHLFICEVNDDGVRFVDRYLKFHHPQESRFSWEQFSNVLTESNFIIEEQSKLIFSYFRSYMCKKNKDNILNI
ncbi:MAG: SAM-dependent methyltransferase [Ignavibacteriae bacterium]|nr:MAG: SAM-dependent methyltransferase [Ignavibacteriota bacterium]